MRDTGAPSDGMESHGFTVWTGGLMELSFWKRMKFLFTNRLHIVSGVTIDISDGATRVIDGLFRGAVLGRQEEIPPVRAVADELTGEESKPVTTTAMAN